ncbi:MAG: hypothetical protein WA432_04240 [Candidatus Babeliaceae bacterium]
MQKKLLLCLYLTTQSIYAMNPHNNLFKAIYPHKTDEVRKILKNKQIDVNQADIRGITPLQIARADGDINTMKVLLENGATVDNTTVILGMHNDLPEMIRLAIQYGVMPTQELTRAAIQWIKPHALSQLLILGSPVDQNDWILTKKRYEINKHQSSPHWRYVHDANLKRIGKILINHLKLTTARGLISKNGMMLSGSLSKLPPELVEHIATFMHELE